MLERIYAARFSSLSAICSHFFFVLEMAIIPAGMEILYVQESPYTKGDGISRNYSALHKNVQRIINEVGDKWQKLIGAFKHSPLRLPFTSREFESSELGVSPVLDLFSLLNVII